MRNNCGVGYTLPLKLVYRSCATLPNSLFIKAAVICKRDISRNLDGYFSTFGGNPVSCSIGLAVLRVLKNENLKSSTNNVGRIMESLLSDILTKYPRHVGDIRGQGLIWAMEIVKNKSKQPDSELARKIVDLMRVQEKILLGLIGTKTNILLFTPPLCFTTENSRRYLSKELLLFIPPL